MIYSTATVPVNPEGETPLTRAEAWQGLERKARDARLFLPAGLCTRCDVVAESPTHFVREATIAGQDLRDPVTGILKLFHCIDQHRIEVAACRPSCDLRSGICESCEDDAVILSGRDQIVPKKRPVLSLGIGRSKKWRRRDEAPFLKDVYNARAII